MFSQGLRVSASEIMGALVQSLRSGALAETGAALFIYNCKNLIKAGCFGMWITAENVDKTVDNYVDNFADFCKNPVDNSEFSTC